MQGYFERFPDCTIVIVGDVILDTYLQGEVSRISPEAPVPVVRCTSERRVPGGAANVAMNVVSLGAMARLIGVTGADESHETLKTLLAMPGRVDVAGLVRDPARPTTEKIRVIGQHQQVVRIDREANAPLSREMAAKIVDHAAVAIAGADIVIFSDYGKGVFDDDVLRRLLVQTAALGKPVIVDPKRKDWSNYRGVSLVTPNCKELIEATGLPCETDEEIEAAARRAKDITGAEILVTRSEKGMSFVPLQGPALHVPTLAQEVFDVSGAGDTVVAVLATALAAGTPMADAIKLANHAAGIVVSKFGTATVSTAELMDAVVSRSADASAESGACLTLEEAVSLRQEWAAKNLTVGLANGCFDVLHPGHISLIGQAAASCDRLIVAINSDNSARRLKGPQRPIQNELDRAQVIGAIKEVAAVVIFDEDTPYEVIRALKPDVLIKGADYREEDVVGADIVRGRGGKVLLARLVDGRSTSRLVAKGAGSLLGEPHVGVKLVHSDGEGAS